MKALKTNNQEAKITMGQAASSVRKNGITGIVVAKLNLEHMLRVAKSLKIDLEEQEAEPASTMLSLALKERAVNGLRKVAKDLGLDTGDDYDTLLSDVRASEGGEDIVKEGFFELFECDICAGESPGDIPLEVCPFCADGNEIGSTSDVNKTAKTAKPKEAAAPKAVARAVEKAAAPPKPAAPPVPEAAPPVVAKKSAKLATVDDTRPASAMVSTKDLDAKVEEIKRLKVTAASSGWKIGKLVAEIIDSGAWQLRVDEKNKQKFKTAEAFFLHEVGMAESSYKKLIDIAHDHGEKAIETWGTKKFLMAMTAPVELQPALVGDVLAGKSKRELEEKIKEANKGRTKKDAKGRTVPATRAPGAGPKPKVEKMVVATLLGKHNLDAVKKPSNRRMEMKDCAPAKKLTDVPWSKIELENNVTLYVSTVVKPNGALRHVVEFRREEDEVDDNEE